MSQIWDQDEEAQRLRARFAKLKADGMSQAEFARVHGVPGGASMINQHVMGRRPISLEAGTAYARGFGVPLEEISPRLARDLAAMTALARAGVVNLADPVAPDPEFSYNAKQLARWFDAIPEGDYKFAVFSELIQLISFRRKKLPPTPSPDESGPAEILGAESTVLPAPAQKPPLPDTGLDAQ